ncbi:MAG: hypothetical protein JO057_31350, partial [Chloroflexi bacterium]|nr:hypothetical protein [Chloroflexota bacterium]
MPARSKRARSSRGRGRAARRLAFKRLGARVAVGAGGLALLIAAGLSRAEALPTLVGAHPPPVAVVQPTPD